MFLVVVVLDWVSNWRVEMSRVCWNLWFCCLIWVFVFLFNIVILKVVWGVLSFIFVVDIVIECFGEYLVIIVLSFFVIFVILFLNFFVYMVCCLVKDLVIIFVILVLVVVWLIECFKILEIIFECVFVDFLFVWRFVVMRIKLNKLFIFFLLLNLKKFVCSFFGVLDSLLVWVVF